MTKITTRIIVTEDGRLSAIDPLPPGEHVATIEVTDPVPGTRAAFDAIPFPQLDVGPWPNGATFSREEIYGDDGR
jgi:hypothetical protein